MILPFAIFNVNDQENYAKEKNDAAHNDITNTEERIFATQQ